MLLWQCESASRRSAPGRTLRQHLLDQEFAGLLIDRPRPTLGTQMNLFDLLIGQDVDPLPGPFQALSKVFARFLLGIGLQLDGVITLFATGQRLQSSQQFMLGKQEDMRTTFITACSEHQQIFQRDVIQLVRIVDQQVNLLTSQRQLPNLRQNGAHVSLCDGQALRYLTQQRFATGDTLRNHDALHRLLVGTGNQRLAQQRLAAALGPDYRQQQLAIARKVMQLPQYRFALRRKELETGHSRRERVVTELVMSEESFVSMQTGHESLFKSWTTEPARRSRYAAWRREFRAGSPRSLPLHPGA